MGTVPIKLMAMPSSHSDAIERFARGVLSPLVRDFGT